MRSLKHQEYELLDMYVYEYVALWPVAGYDLYYFTLQ